MSAHPSLVVPDDLGQEVRRIVAEVLMVSEESVGPQTALVAELGAESLDFLDIVFRLEQLLDRKIQVSRWGAYVKERLPERDLATAITLDTVRDFALRESEAG
jgi:acyl carrier protein